MVVEHLLPCRTFTHRFFVQKVDWLYVVHGCVQTCIVYPVGIDAGVLHIVSKGDRPCPTLAKRFTDCASRITQNCSCFHRQSPIAILCSRRNST